MKVGTVASGIAGAIIVAVVSCSVPLWAQDQVALPVYGLDISPGGELLAASGGNRDLGEGVVNVWNCANWGAVLTHHHPVSVNCVAFSASGQLLAAGTHKGEVLLFDMANGEIVRQWSTDQTSINGVCFAQGERLLTAGGDGRINEFDLSTGDLLRKFDTWQADGVLDTVQQPRDAQGSERDPRELWDVAVSSDGRWLVSGGWGDTTRLWDYETGQQLFSYAATQSYVQGVTFTPDNSHFVGLSVGGALVVRETETGIERLAIQVGGRDVAIHPESQFVAAAAWDGIRVYEFDLTYPTDEELEEYVLLLEQLEDDDVDVREATTQAIAEVGLPIELLLYDAIFSPYAETRMRARRLWNQVRSPEPLFQMDNHLDEPRQVRFSPDGSILVSASKGGDVCIWSVPEFALLHTLTVSSRSQ